MAAAWLMRRTGRDAAFVLDEVLGEEVLKRPRHVPRARETVTPVFLIGASRLRRTDRANASPALCQ